MYYLIVRVISSLFDSVTITAKTREASFLLTITTRIFLVYYAYILKFTTRIFLRIELVSDGS